MKKHTGHIYKHMDLVKVLLFISCIWNAKSFLKKKKVQSEQTGKTRVVQPKTNSYYTHVVAVKEKAPLFWHELE